MRGGEGMSLRARKAQATMEVPGHVSLGDLSAVEGWALTLLNKVIKNLGIKIIQMRLF